MKLNCYGSCRVFEPLDLLARYQLIDAYKYKAKWYTHSPFETLQKHKILTGEIDFCFSDFKYLIADTNKVDKLYAQLKDFKKHRDYVIDSDFTIIEISSLKALVNKTVDLEYQHLGLYNEFKKNNLKGYAGFENSFIQSTSDEFYASLEVLIDKIGAKKCLIIGYIETGAPARKLINELLCEISNKKGCFFFNPTTVLEKHELTDVMLNDTHYNPPFFNILAAKLCEFIFNKEQEKMNFYVQFFEYLYKQSLGTLSGTHEFKKLFMQAPCFEALRALNKICHERG